MTAVSAVSKSLKTNEILIKSAFGESGLLKTRPVENAALKNRYLICYTEDMTDGASIGEGIVEAIVRFNGPAPENGVSFIASDVVTSPDVTVKTDFQELINGVCDGAVAVFAEGDDRALLIDAKGYRTKAISEPLGETISKGPHEGFTEDMLINVSLIRRKIASPDLKTEILTVGADTRTKICICYLATAAESGLVADVKKRISGIKRADVLDSNYITESIRDHPLSPFKTVGSSERPDVVASKILEGRVAVIVNGTPAVLTAPFLFTEYFQSSEDYYVSFYYATVGRILRLLSFFISVSLPALYVAFTNFHQEEIPIKLFVAIAASRDGVPISNILEIVVMLIGFELLREAGERIPASFGVSLSVVGSLVIGQVAVAAKLVSAPVVFVIAITATAGLMTMNMKGANIIIRALFLAASAVLGLFGYILAVTAVCCRLYSMTSFGVDYMAYLMPLSGRRSPDVPLRLPITKMKSRPYFAAKRGIKSEDGN